MRQKARRLGELSDIAGLTHSKGQREGSLGGSKYIEYTVEGRFNRTFGESWRQRHSAQRCACLTILCSITLGKALGIMMDFKAQKLRPLWPIGE